MKSQVAHSVAEGGAQSREMPVLLHEWLLAWQDFDQSRWYLMRGEKLEVGEAPMNDEGRWLAAEVLTKVVEVVQQVAGGLKKEAAVVLGERVSMACVTQVEVVAFCQ
jgi:hypothetical protein